jgi:hypothetical protein
VEENDSKSEHPENVSDSEKEKGEDNIRERTQKSREQRSEEKRQYDNIVSKHNMRKFRRGKTNLVQSERQHLDEIQDWIKLYNKNSKTKQILKEENNEIYLKCEELEKAKEGNVLQIDEVKESSEECSCDYDKNCAYCLEVYENEKGLIEEVHWTAEDDAAELKEYRDMKIKQGERNTKKKLKAQMLPSLQYQKENSTSMRR